MKRKSIFLLVGFFVLTACACLLLRLSHSKTGLANQTQFESFPIDKEVNIDLNFAASINDEYTEREKRDQAKDWLLYTALSAANLSLKELNEVTYDLPIDRHGYNRNVFNLDYGDTRSRYIGNGVVIAVIPESTGNQEVDYLAHIADEQRKNLGQMPEVFKLFKYKIDLPHHRASLTHVDAPQVRTLFTTEGGYYEQAISGLDDLRKFLERTQDITYASNKDGTLILGGRQLKGSTYKKINLEDIAAIWQSEEEIQKKNIEFDQRWSNRTYTTEAEKLALEEQRSREIRDLGVVNGSGFSLDPVFDYGVLSNLLAKIRYRLLDYVSEEDLIRAETGLNNRNERGLLAIISKLEEDNNTSYNAVGKYLQQLVFSTRIQKARYDGELKGTAVGMHLFYTDLLAKLWCINYIHSSPNNVIEDFTSDPETGKTLPKIYTKEASRFPSARLWFGPNPLGYQIADERRQLLFARNATKIYSASSNPLDSGHEVNTSALFDASTDWWNNHYEEVGRYEQEYECLNEIMKWSTIISWLNVDEDRSLNFLSAVKVNHDFWFSDWVKTQGSLKFNQWDQIMFFKKGYKGFDTETIPILRSAPFLGSYGSTLQSISGGVSLAEKSVLKEARALPKTANELIRRSNLDYSMLGDEIRTIKGRVSKIVNEEGIFKVVSKAEDNAVLRSRFGEVGNNTFEKSLSKTSDDVSFKVNYNGTSLGDLDISKTPNGFSVGFASRDIDNGQSLARQISDSYDPELVLNSNETVETYIKVGDSKEFLIKQKGSDKWIHLETEPEPEVALSTKWDARVSGNKENSMVCNLKWVEGKEISGIKGQKRLALDADGKLSLELVSPADESMLVPFYLKAETGTKAYFNPRTSKIYFDGQVIGNEKFDISSLHRLLGEEDILKIKQMAGAGRDFEYRIDKAYSLKNDLLHSYENARYGEFLERLDKAEDVASIKSALRKEKIDDLRKLDSELDPVRHQASLDALYRKYGSIPELRFRKGLSKLETSGYKGGEDMINQTLKGFKNNKQFYEEVNTLIRNSELSEHNKRVLLSVADYNAGKGKFVQATFETLPKGTQVPLKSALNEVKQGKSVVFIQENPSLNNMDWNVAIDPVTLLSMHNPVCIRLNPQTLRTYSMQIEVHLEVALDGKLTYNVKAVPRTRYVHVRGGRDSSRNAAPDDHNDYDEDDNDQPAAVYYIYFPVVAKI